MRNVAVMIAGVLMAGGALAHGIGGWPPLADELVELGVGIDLIASLALGWYFGSAAMAMFGMITFDVGRRLNRGEPTRTLSVKLIAIGYIGFGIAAFIFRSNALFLMFSALGLMSGIPVFRKQAPAATE